MLLRGESGGAALDSIQAEAAPSADGSAPEPASSSRKSQGPAAGSTGAVDGSSAKLHVTFAAAGGAGSDSMPQASSAPPGSASMPQASSALPGSASMAQAASLPPWGGGNLEPLVSTAGTLAFAVALDAEAGGEASSLPPSPQQVGAAMELDAGAWVGAAAGVLAGSQQQQPQQQLPPRRGSHGGGSAAPIMGGAGATRSASTRQAAASKRPWK